MKLYQAIAQTVGAYHRCVESGNTEWTEKHRDRLNKLADLLPHGSGFNNATSIDWEDSTENKLILRTSFHHMDEYGHYDGWTEHDVTVRPDLISGFKLKISGRDRDGWKEYAYQTFDAILHEDVADRA